MTGLKSKKIWVFFTHLELWIAVARHNSMWVKIYIFISTLYGLTLVVFNSEHKISYYQATLALDAIKKILSIVRSVRDREVACSTSDFQGLNFKTGIWREV